MYSCKIILDSISETGKRLTTFEITFPRIVLAEAKTHRVLRGWGQNVELEYLELDLYNLGINDDENLSRNSASSRAIPLEKQIQRIKEDPFVPERFPLNCSGMQPQEYIDQHHPDYPNHVLRWLSMRDDAIAIALANKSIYNWHKQLISRPLEVFMWHTAIVTATEWDNFFKLRTHPDAQYEIKRIADLMYEAYHAFDGVGEHIAGIGNEGWSATRTQKLKVGEWHCPLVYEEDDELIYKLWRTASGDKYNWIVGVVGEGEIVSKQIRKMISVARCARVSYLTHDGKRDIEKDLELFERLRTSGHWSPFEHVATPYFTENVLKLSEKEREDAFCLRRRDSNATVYDKNSGNFIGWKQMRKEFSDENCTYFRK